MKAELAHLQTKIDLLKISQTILSLLKNTEQGDTENASCPEVAELFEILKKWEEKDRPILPPVHAGFIFPKDKGRIDWLSTNQKRAIRLLALPSETIDQAREKFEDLRHFALKYRCDDFTLIDCICTWGELIYRDPETLIAQVKNSILATRLQEAKADLVSARGELIRD